MTAWRWAWNDWTPVVFWRWAKQKRENARLRRVVRAMVAAQLGEVPELTRRDRARLFDGIMRGVIEAKARGETHGTLAVTLDPGVDRPADVRHLTDGRGYRPRVAVHGFDHIETSDEFVERARSEGRLS